MSLDERQFIILVPAYRGHCVRTRHTIHIYMTGNLITSAIGNVPTFERCPLSINRGHAVSNFRRPTRRSIHTRRLSSCCTARRPPAFRPTTGRAAPRPDSKSSPCPPGPPLVSRGPRSWLTACPRPRLRGAPGPVSLQNGGENDGKFRNSNL